MKLKAIIWDVDGTLVDSEELHREAFNWAFTQVGLDWNWSIPVYGKLLEVTGGKERIRFFMEQSSLSEKQLPVSPEEMHALKTGYYSRSVCEGRLVLRNGVDCILKEAIGAGVRLAIATTTTPSNVEDLFVSGVIKKEQWEVVVAGDEVEKKKPAPDVYLEALNRLALSPKDCLAIEDSENGMNSAFQAGVPTVITTNRYTINQSFGKEFALVHDFGDGSPINSCANKTITLRHLEAWHLAATTTLIS